MMHRHSYENATGGRKVLLGAAHIGIGVVFVSGVVLLFGYVVMWLWNAILPDVLGVRQVNFWQAVGLLILARLLVGSFHHKHHGGPRRRQRCGPTDPCKSLLDRFVEHGRPPREE